MSDNLPGSTRLALVDVLRLGAVTPLVVGGAAGPGGRPEGLRVPSLRGSLRWWLRAAVADHVGGDEALRFEQTVFGGGDAGAVVDLWTLSRSGGHTTAHLRMNDPRPRIVGGRALVAQREALAANARLDLMVHFRNHVDAGTRRRFAGTLDLLLLLGGVGSRWRRGFGSLWRVDDAGHWSDRVTGETPADRASWMEKRVRDALTVIDGPPPRPPAGSPRGGFRMLRGGGARVYVIEPEEGAWRTWQEAMGDAGAGGGLRDLFYRPLKSRINNWDTWVRSAWSTGGEGVGGIGSFAPREPSPVTIQIKPAESTAGAVSFVGVVCVFFSDWFTDWLAAPPPVSWTEWDRVMAPGFSGLAITPIALP